MYFVTAAQFPKGVHLVGCHLDLVVPCGHPAGAWTWSFRVMKTQNHKQPECLPGSREEEIQFTAYWDCCYITLLDLSPVSLCHSLTNFFVFRSVFRYVCVCVSARVCERMGVWRSGTKSREVFFALHCTGVCRVCAPEVLFQKTTL